MLAACAAPPSGPLAGSSAAAPPAAEPGSLSAERIAQIVDAPDRTDADRTNDQRRKPREMLAFIGLRPGMVVLDVSAAGGYTTELLARAVGPQGVVYGQSRSTAPGRGSPPAAAEGGASAVPPPAGRRTSPTLLAIRNNDLRDHGVAAAVMVPVIRPFEDPAPPERADAGLDRVTLMFNYHDMGHLGVDRTRMNAALFKALKPGGLYVIADHAGRPGTGISESGTLHRIEEDFLKQEVQAAGFRLAGEADFLRNAADPRDKVDPDPPVTKDDFVLKFVKPR